MNFQEFVSFSIFILFNCVVIKLMTLLNYFLFFLILGEFHYRLWKILEGFVSLFIRRKIQEIQKKERQSLYVS